MSIRRALAVTALLFVAPLLPAGAAVAEKEVPFALDQWIDLESTDGEVTVHRVKLLADAGTLAKAGMTRPGDSHSFLRPIQVVVEYTNMDKKDWKAKLRAVWVDADGQEIDGFLTTENLDHEEAKDTAKSSMATLRYALDRAKTLRLRVETVRD